MDYQKQGFADAGEFVRMTSQVDVSTPKKMGAYMKWKERDGTKEGLERLLEKNGSITKTPVKKEELQQDASVFIVPSPGSQDAKSP
jgi:hypothetical protein